MYEIYEELELSIKQLEASIITINGKILKQQNIIKRYNDEILSKPFPNSKAILTPIQIEFQYPSYLSHIKSSYRHVLEIYGKRQIASRSPVVHIDDLNDIKLELRRHTHSSLTSAINKNKPLKAELRQLQNEYRKLQADIVNLKNSILSQRIRHIKDLIETNKSLGYDKLRPLYKFLEDNYIHLNIETPLYFDSSSIKNSIQLLDSTNLKVNSVNTDISELQDEYGKHQLNQLAGSGDDEGSKGTFTPKIIVMSARDGFKNFEYVIWVGFCKRIRLQIGEMSSELMNLESEKKSLESEITTLKWKLEKIKYLPEVRRMIAYENKLSLTNSMTNPGSSTI